MQNKKGLKQRLERIYLLAEIDFNQRYYGSKLGILWAFIQPMSQIFIFYYVFTYLIVRDSGPDFVLYLFTGLITWQFFGEATGRGLNLFRQQKYILENVPIPKIDFFLAHIGSSFYAYLVNFLIFLIFSQLFFSPIYSWDYLYLFPIFIGLLAFTLGIIFILSTFFLFIRDLNHLWSIILKAGFWSIPVIWNYNIVYTEYPFMLYNPLTVFLINIRQITLQRDDLDLNNMYTSIATSFILLIIGYLFMQSKSKKAIEIL